TTPAGVNDLNIWVKKGSRFRGGSVTNGRDVTVRLDDADTEFQVDGDLKVRAGFLDVKDGPSLIVGGDLLLDGGTDFDGNAVGGGGGIGGANTSVRVNQTMRVGVDIGSFALSIFDGASVRAAKGHLGFGPGSTGNLGIDGAKSSWQLIGTGLAAGVSGTGKVTVKNGGLLSISSDDPIAFGLGVASGGQGRVEADGKGTLIDATAAQTRLGAAANSTGTILLTSGARLLLGQDSFIGYDGSGSIVASDGSQIVVSGRGAIGIGFTASGHGSLSVQAAKSSFSIQSLFVIGLAGSGFAGVGAGAEATTAGTQLAVISGSTGQVVVDGKGSRWLDSKGFVVGGDVHANVQGGTASVTVTNEGFIHAGRILLLGAGGTITLDDAGSIAVGGTAYTPGTVRVSGGGALAGDGTIHGDVIVTAGSGVTPGYLKGRPIGTLTVDGTYQQAANAFLNIGIAGTAPGTGYSRLHVTGQASLQGGLHMRRFGGFVPSAGQTFTVLDASSIVGKFSEVTGGTVTYNANSVVVTIAAPSIGDAAGTYRGLASAPAPQMAPLANGGPRFAPGDEAAGFFTLTLQESGNFTAKFTLGAKVYSFKAAFDNTGHFTQQITTGGQTLMIDLTADLDGGTDTVTGTIALGGVNYQINGDRAGTGDPSALLQLASAYTITLPSDADNSDPNAPRPQATGWATASIGKTGLVQLVGKLADGTAFSAGGSLSKDNALDAFARLYKNAGLIGGELTLLTPDPLAADPSASDVTGMLRWKKPSATKGLFQEGFDTPLTAFGSAYAPAAPNQRVLPTGINGAATLNFTDADVGGTLTKAVTISTKNTSTYPHPTSPADKLTLTFATKSGAFAGKFLNPATGKQTPFGGVVLSKASRGAGYFLGTTDSGNVTLTLGP
ncbi:MAG: hypothetical protein WCF18_12335, partial [Chthoniobacteraceae bacterium]